MRKLDLICLILLMIALCFMLIKTPPIKLPQLAHHKTIGALPFIKAIDHGGFSYYNACVSALVGQCETIKNKKTREKCKELMERECRTRNGIPQCEPLKKAGKKFGVFLCFTCEGAMPIIWEND